MSPRVPKRRRLAPVETVSVSSEAATPSVSDSNLTRERTVGEQRILMEDILHGSSLMLLPASVTQCRTAKWQRQMSTLPARAGLIAGPPAGFTTWVPSLTEVPSISLANDPVYSPAEREVTASSATLYEGQWIPTFTKAEYACALADPSWTIADTLVLCEFARLLSARWEVIHDRWITLVTKGKESPMYSVARAAVRAAGILDEELPSIPRSVNDLKNRVYKCHENILKLRSQTAPSLAASLAHHPVLATPYNLAPDAQCNEQWVSLWEGTNDPSQHLTGLIGRLKSVVARTAQAVALRALHKDQLTDASRVAGVRLPVGRGDVASVSLEVPDASAGEGGTRPYGLPRGLTAGTYLRSHLIERASGRLSEADDLVHEVDAVAVPTARVFEAAHGLRVAVAHVLALRRRIARVTLQLQLQRNRRENE